MPTFSDLSASGSKLDNVLDFIRVSGCISVKPDFNVSYAFPISPSSNNDFFAPFIASLIFFILFGSNPSDKFSNEFARIGILTGSMMPIAVVFPCSAFSFKVIGYIEGDMNHAVRQVDEEKFFLVLFNKGNGPFGVLLGQLFLVLP